MKLQEASANQLLAIAGVPITCPKCHALMGKDGTAAKCQSCRRSYPSVDGIPVLLNDPEASVHDEIGEHSHFDNSKKGQIEFFDREEAAEFETERPNGSPRLYAWLLQQKFRKSTSKLGTVLRGGNVLTVCGGSGMDAEYLARTAAHVVSSDISLGAARRAMERATRHGVGITAVVADVERLPFADRSFDVVYVHDGLHHLKDPVLGLREMARVAKYAISITEPAEAFLTQVAVRLGLARAYEDAGNRVARLVPALVSMELERLGYQVVAEERYLMYYQHFPGPISRALSLAAIFPFTKLVVRGINVLARHAGNKMNIQAIRIREGLQDG
jgi:ubiquinone/menaquinone biosynthesis C-methylase UbiE/uncharacterized protein YbaR (Trm112 family)